MALQPEKKKQKTIVLVAFFLQDINIFAGYKYS